MFRPFVRCSAPDVTTLQCSDAVEIRRWGDGRTKFQPAWLCLPPSASALVWEVGRKEPFTKEEAMAAIRSYTTQLNRCFSEREIEELQHSPVQSESLRTLSGVFAGAYGSEKGKGGKLCGGKAASGKVSTAVLLCKSLFHMTWPLLPALSPVALNRVLGAALLHCHCRRTCGALLG